jgi:hypothetical protein
MVRPRRGSPAADDAFCADQDRGTTGSTGRASSARALGDAKNRRGQPDSRPLARTWPYPAQKPKSRRSGTSGDLTDPALRLAGSFRMLLGQTAVRTGTPLGTHRTDGCCNPANGQRERGLPTSHRHPVSRSSDCDRPDRCDSATAADFGEGKIRRPGWG